MSYQEILSAGSRPNADVEGDQDSYAPSKKINGRQAQIDSYNHALAAANRHIGAAQLSPDGGTVDAQSMRMAASSTGATMNASETSASLGLRSGTRTWSQIGSPQSGKN